MYCTKCGKQNEDNAKFCVACGEKLDGTQGQSTAYQMGINMPYQAKKKSHKKAVIGITVVAVILILIISAGTSGSGRLCSHETVRIAIDHQDYRFINHHCKDCAG